MDNNYIYTREETGVHNKIGFTDARVLCIPPKSYPPATVLWSNATSNKFLDFGRNSRIRRVDEYVREGVKYYSLVIKNAVQLVGQSYGCVVYNADIGGKPFYIANSKIVIYGKNIKELTAVVFDQIFYFMDYYYGYFFISCVIILCGNLFNP